jgi:cobyrinic acid a,c-diamide synthase
VAQVSIPRIVIAATGSGVGKTTLTVGLIASLRARGLRVAPFKCGPDYLDPTYHGRAAGQPSHNLDGWMMGQTGVLTTFTSAARGADIAIVEGMMGLYDGATPTGEAGSTAEIAKWLEAPVLLVVDAGGIARTIAAIGLGFTRFDPALKLAGLLGNHLGGRGHLELLRAAAPEISILGGLPRASEGGFPERHLGLFAAATAAVPDRFFRIWGDLVEAWCDLDAILRIARAAPPLESSISDATGAASARCRLGLADDEAFHFYYEYNLRRLEAVGAELVGFSPTYDRQLPPVDGIYLGGGYPEVVASRLSANQSMLNAIRDFARAGGPIYAECGGLMYLTECIRTLEGETHRMVGLIPGTAVMHDRLQAIGYATITTRADSFLGAAGTVWRGHQFRYSSLIPTPPPTVPRLYTVAPHWGGEPFSEGFQCGNVVGSYVHSHWASNPAVADNFVRACAVARRTPAI